MVLSHLLYHPLRSSSITTDSYTPRAVELLMAEILLDTNFLLLPGEYRVDIFAEIKRIMTGPQQLVILDRTIDELNALALTGKPRQKPAAKIALLLLKKHKVRVIETGRTIHVDKLIKDYASRVPRGELIIATQDAPLKKALARHHVPLIVMRKKQYLELQGL